MKKHLLSAGILFLAVFGLVAQNDCNNFYPQVSPDGNYLYFVSDRNSEYYEIYRADIDGQSNLVRLIQSEDDIFMFSLNPDGTKIVFQQGGYSSSAEIYIMNADGTGLTRLTNNSGFDGYPKFSPDGQTIIFAAWDASPYPEIFTMNTDGSNRTQLTNEAGVYWQSEPTYHPSGEKIYFSEGFNADNYFVMMDLDGTNWVNITEPNEFGYAENGLQFNEDGSKIIFLTTEWVGYDNGSDLVMADSDGSNWTRLTHSENGEYFYFGTFNKFDDKIYYAYREYNGKFRIYKMDMDGSNSVQISNCSGVGIDENQEAGIGFIYPNPVSTQLKVNYEDDFMIEIFNLTGQIVLTSEESAIDVSMLKSGLYFVILKDRLGNPVFHQKIVKE